MGGYGVCAEDHVGVIKAHAPLLLIQQPGKEKATTRTPSPLADDTEAVPAALCWVCQEGARPGLKLFPSCGCRGSGSRVHLPCLVHVAAQDEETWTACPDCSAEWSDPGLRRGLTLARLSMSAGVAAGQCDSDDEIASEGRGRRHTLKRPRESKAEAVAQDISPVRRCVCGDCGSAETGLSIGEVWVLSCQLPKHLRVLCCAG